MQLDFNKVSQGSSLNFSKDLNLDFSKTTNIVINLNWKGRTSVDLDSCLALVDSTVEKTGFIDRLFGRSDKSSKVANFVYCGDRYCAKNKGITHHGDDLTGAWAAGEFIEIDASKLPETINELIPSVLSFRGYNMADLDFAHMRVYLGTTDKVEKPLFEVDLTGLANDVKGVQFGKLVRNDLGEWVWTTDLKTTKSYGWNGFDVLKDMAAR